MGLLDENYRIVRDFGVEEYGDDVILLAFVIVDGNNSEEDSNGR